VAFQCLAPPNGSGVQLRQTALTASAGAETPAARMLPRIDSAALFGVSCNGLLGGVCNYCLGWMPDPVLHVAEDSEA